MKRRLYVALMASPNSIYRLVLFDTIVFVFTIGVVVGIRQYMQSLNFNFDLMAGIITGLTVVVCINAIISTAQQGEEENP